MAPSRMKPIKDALTVQESQPGLYKAAVAADYCYGDWAWGGLSSSLIHTVATKYATKNGTDLRHPDVINMQLQFLRPVLRKDIELSVKDVRSTKTFSTVHVAIIQGGKECIVGYVNVSNLRDAKGPTFDTKWELHPAPAPVSIAELENNTSPDWYRYTVEYVQSSWFRLQSLAHFVLPATLAGPSIADEWLTPTDPQNTFTNESLSMVADLWTPFIENYNPKSAVSHEKLLGMAKKHRELSPEGIADMSRKFQSKGWSSPIMITTLSLTLEVKKRLPPEGVKWLFLRAYAKAIKQGSFDVEVVILDENMELVALSHQIALATVYRPELRDKERALSKPKI